MKRSLSFALLALHLLVFVIGGVLATETSAVASGRRAVVVATASGADGALVASPSGARFEIGTRARGDRERGSNGLALDVVVPRAHGAVGPAELTGLRDWRSAAHGHRSLLCVANGARAPPPGR